MNFFLFSKNLGDAFILDWILLHAGPEKIVAYLILHTLKATLKNWSY